MKKVFECTDCKIKKEHYTMSNLLEAIWLYANMSNNMALIELINNYTDMFKNYNQKVKEDNEKVLAEVINGEFFNEPTLKKYFANRI